MNGVFFNAIAPFVVQSEKILGAGEALLRCLLEQFRGLVNILFPELESLVPILHMNSVYALLESFPSAFHIANANITKLSNILNSASHGRYKKDKAIEIKKSAKTSVACYMPAKSLELKHIIALIHILSDEINEIELEIKNIMKSINSPITSIPGIGINTAAMILSEIGDFNNFDSPDKILAFCRFISFHLSIR